MTLTVGGLTVTRLVWPHSSVLGAMMLVGCLTLATTLLGLTALRDHALSRDPTRGPDGVLLGVVTAGTCLVGGAALALVGLR